MQQDLTIQSETAPDLQLEGDERIDTASPEAQAILALTDEEIAALPDEQRQQVMDLRDRVKAELDRQAEERQRRVQALGQHVVDTYNQRLTQREHIEERWHRDIRRFNGEYEPDVKRALESRVFGSRVFVPLARRVINVVFARLIDLIFPTEERNFVVKSSPVPQLARAEQLARRLSPEAMVDLPDGRKVKATAVELAIRELREEAENRAAAMQREIDDQLRQANWGKVGRDCVREAMIIGTGVVKGPIVLNRQKKVWHMASGQSSLELVEDLSPTVTAPSVWDFFPDMTARKIGDSESEIERHYLTAAQLAKLANQPGFDGEAIRRVLRTKPSHKTDPARDRLKEGAGTAGIPDPRYLMLEFHGPVDAELLRDLNVKLPDDPLIYYEAVLFVMEDGTVVKAVINPMDTQERPYSVYCWEEDPACIFGYGLSYEVADMVESCNSSFRAAMDNLGLSVGGQVVVNDKLVEPQNGRWAIEPNKVWIAKKADADVRAAFAFFQIETRLNELMQVFDRSKQLIDDIAGPAMAMQGQDAPSYLDTARGAGIAWTAANIWMRRGVRNWDDDITAPVVGRFVDWNMQYNPKEDIKGDLLVQARGFSGLLESEGQAQKVQLFMKSIEGMPMPFKRRVAQARMFARSLRIDEADVLPDDAEVAKIAQVVDNQGPPPNPELERIRLRQAELQDNERQREHAERLAAQTYQLRLAEIASKEGLSVAQVQAKYGLEQLRLAAQLQDKREARAQEAQMFNAEMVTKTAMGSGI